MTTVQARLQYVINRNVGKRVALYSYLLYPVFGPFLEPFGTPE